MKIVAVGDEFFVFGFQIGGINDAYIVDDKNANSVIESVSNDSDIAVVVINNEVFNMLSTRNKSMINTKIKPIFVVLSHDISGTDNLRDMIKKSLGIDLWSQDAK